MITLRGSEEAHADLLGDGGHVDTAGRNGKDIIGECKYDAAHDAAHGIPVMIGQMHGAYSRFLSEGVDGDAVFHGKVIMIEVMVHLL